jgi:hypothetical protein
MKTLTVIGYWRSTSEPQWPDPNEFVDEAWDNAEREAVASYLEGGRVPGIQLGYSRCRLCGCENGCAELTDGTYLWPEGLSHYVREHAVRLPVQVVQHILKEPKRLRPDNVDQAWWKGATPDWRD